MDPNFATTTNANTTATTRPSISSLPHPSQTQTQTHPFLYPVSSSGRGFIAKGIRPFSAADPHNHNHIGNNPSSLPYSPGVRAHLDYLNHLTKQFPHLAHTLPTPAPSSSPHSVKPLSLSPHQHPKAAPRSAVSGSNGYKDSSSRERSRDDKVYIIRDRKVRITEDASLYTLCRSWLRNGVNEENQPRQKDALKALPKPLAASMVAGHMSDKKEEKDNDEREENEESVEHLSPQDLLKRHIKRAKKVRARLREERLQRITRYRSRLRLLLPPPVEYSKNDTAAAGN